MKRTARVLNFGVAVVDWEFNMNIILCDLCENPTVNPKNTDLGMQCEDCIKNCKHENTIRVGDEDHEEIFCTDCKGSESESEYVERKEREEVK